MSAAKLFLVMINIVLLSSMNVGAFSSPKVFGMTVKSQHCKSLKMSDSAFEITVDIPPSSSGLQAQMNIKPVLDIPSKIVEVRYKLPFGLDVAPKEGFAVCTKDGPGGEKVGDVLRYTSQWTMGLPRGDGLISTAASFSGGVSWQCSLFDVMKASRWEEVVAALTSNVDSRTDEVVLLFERPLEQ